MARHKRGADETVRTKVWYEQVNEMLYNAGIVKRNTAGRTIGRAIEKKGRSLKNKRAIGSKTMQDLGTEEAWRWYQEGARTPKPKTTEAVDVLLTKLGLLPVSFILSAPGEIELEPVWAWPISRSGIPGELLGPLAAVEAATWKKNGGIDPAVVAEAAKGNFHHPEEEQEEEGAKYKNLFWEYFFLSEEECAGTCPGYFDYSWPPLLLIPKVLSQELSKDKSCPFPHLLDTPPECPSPLDEQPCWEAYLAEPMNVIKHFRKWSFSRKAASEPGSVWAKELQLLPRSDFVFTMSSNSSLFDERISDESDHQKMDEMREIRHILNTSAMTENDGR